MVDDPINFGEAIKNVKPPFKIPKVKVQLSRGIKFLIVILAVVLLAYNVLFVYVEPNEFGIKVVRMGIHRGVQQKVYTAGLNLVIPGIQQMHRLPRDVQVLELTAFPNTAADAARKDKAAHIQTSDGFFVDVDVSILYRIKDPYLVFTKIGPGSLFEHNGIIPKAEPALKETLGKLTTEDFYNSPKRVKQVQEARSLLNRELAPKGIQVEHVLVRYFRYSQEIQKNIEEKKLKHQLVFTNQAAGRAAREEAELKLGLQLIPAFMDDQRFLARLRRMGEKQGYTLTGADPAAASNPLDTRVAVEVSTSRCPPSWRRRKAR